ncbi:hypothetical protein ACLOAV_004245 [Pseudogymnoascus australis]
MSQPTKDYVKRSTCPSDIVEKYDTQAKTLNLAEWKTSDTIIPLKVIRALVPTAWPYLLVSNIIKAISLSGATTQKFGLELPVQIRAYSNGDDSTVTNNREDLSSDIEELPAYE